MRTFRWGLVAVAAYLAVAAVSFRTELVPVRPLFDGLAPPARYRWVDPPPDLAEGNEPALPGSGQVTLDVAGSQSRSLSTDDGQGAVILPQGAIAPREGETVVNVTIAQKAPPATPEAPGELAIDGNVYEVQATYEISGEPVTLTRPATVVLRYPVHATDVLRLEGSVWTKLETNPSRGTLQVFADTTLLGTFAAAGIPPEPPSPPGPPRWAYAAAGAGLAVTAGGVLGVRWRSRRKRRPKTRADRRRARRGRR